MTKLNSQMFQAEGEVYRFVKIQSPSRKWKLYKHKQGTADGWIVVKSKMSKAEAERINKLLRS